MAALRSQFDIARMSPVCEVHFAGFSSDTYRLQCNGWQIATSEEPMRGGITLLLNHKASGIQAVAVSMERFYATEWHSMHGRGVRPPEFNVIKLASDMRIRVERISTAVSMIPNFDNFRLADMTPQTIEVKEYEIGKLPLFAEAKKTFAEQLIIPQRDISELLAEIRSRQAPNIAEIREREKRREIETIHSASILAIAA